MILLQVDPELIEIAKQFSTPAEQLVVYLGGAIMATLIGAIIILWTSLNKERTYNRTQDIENLKVITKLTTVLEGLGEGVKVSLPRQMDDLKTHLGERISDLKSHLK